MLFQKNLSSNDIVDLSNLKHVCVNRICKIDKQMWTFLNATGQIKAGGHKNNGLTTLSKQFCSRIDAMPSDLMVTQTKLSHVVRDAKTAPNHLALPSDNGEPLIPIAAGRHLYLAVNDSLPAGRLLISHDSTLETKVVEL